MLDQLPGSWFAELACPCVGRCLAGCLDDRLQNISVADLEPTGFSGKVNNQRSGVDTAKFKFLRGRGESDGKDGKNKKR